MEDAQPLGYNIKVLRWLQLWPTRDRAHFSYIVKNCLFNLYVYLSGTAVTVGSIRQLVIGVDDASALVGSSIGSIDFLGFAYMNCCFFANVSKIKGVARAICKFKRYCPKQVMVETELKIIKYSKALFSYCLFGNILNASLALYGGLTNCIRPNQLLYERDPCGYPSRCYYPMNVSGFPLFWIMFFVQTVSCFIITLGILAVTLFIVGVLMHTVAQLKHCASIIAESDLETDTSTTAVVRRFKNIVNYHCAIIKYSKETNLAFNTMMLFHITVTSLVLSILGLNIVTVGNVTEGFRFMLHLCGWLVLLSLICYYGQQLIDESNKIGTAVYSFKWFEVRPSVRKDLQLIMARSQRPLTLTAFNLGVVSYDMLLKIIKTSYSYFTLFINLKS